MFYALVSWLCGAVWLSWGDFQMQREQTEQKSCLIQFGKIGEFIGITYGKMGDSWQLYHQNVSSSVSFFKLLYALTFIKLFVAGAGGSGGLILEGWSGKALVNTLWSSYFARREC